MTDAEEPLDRQNETHALQVVSYLWEEYGYRHDMVWKLAFRVTAVAAALLIAPFLADESVQKIVRYWLLSLPALAVVVILGGMFMLQSELERLDQIRQAYRRAQNDALDYLRPDWRPHPLPRRPSRWGLLRRLGSAEFNERVFVYLVLLLLAALFFFFVFLFVWLPEIVQAPVGSAAR